jgi:hypothetical protein
MKNIFLLLLLMSDVCFGQQFTSLTFPIDFPQVALGGDLSGVNYVTLLQVVNNNSVATTGHLTLHGDDGSPLTALFDGQGPQATLDISLAAGQARQIQITTNGPVTSGWMEITYTPSDALTTVILQLRSGNALLSEVGVQPADTVSSADFAADTDTNLNTGVAIVNPEATAGNFLVSLWDPNSGSALANAKVSLAANGHVARLLTELFPSVAGIAQIRAKISINACADANCTGPGGDFIATAIRLNGDQFTAIPVSSDVEGGDPVRILPQVAFGGPAAGINMKTVLYFTTNVSSGVFGTASIFDNDGNPLAASADGGAPSASMTFTVLGNRVSRVVLAGDQTLRSGWIRLTLSGPVNLIASAVFQTFNGTNLISEAGVLESPPANTSLIYVKSETGGSNVGVALANWQTSSNSLTLQLFDNVGTLLDTQTVTLPPNGHVAKFVTELFPQLSSVADFNGAVAIRSQTQFSAVALRLSPTTLATIPVWTNGMYRPSLTGLRITRTQRNPAQVDFQIDVSDLDADTATSSSTAVAALAALDFGDGSGPDADVISLNGSAVVNLKSGTLSGSFRPPGINSLPSGTQAAFLIVIGDSAGNSSNVLYTIIRF